MKTIEDVKKEKVNEKLKDDAFFYHFIEYSFPKTLSEVVFNRDKSPYYIKPGQETLINEIWLEGLSLMHYAGLGEKSFNEILFNKSDKRYSFYIEGHNNALPFISIKKINDIFFIKLGAPCFYISLPSFQVDCNSIFLQDYLSAISKYIVKENSYYSKCIEIIDEFIEQIQNIYPELSMIKDAVKMLSILVYPCNLHLHKYYYSCVPPAFNIMLEKSCKEISAGGIAAFFDRSMAKDIILNDKYYSIREWANIYTAKSIIDYTRKESIKATKAAIMSRNISHNLGSHVMAYLKNKLGSVSDIVKQRALIELTSSESLIELKSKLKDCDGEDCLFSEKIELPFLVGLGNFISYLQEREDYIATVATSYIPYYMSLNFKDAIFDVLNPDLRFLRHQGRQGGRPDNIILSYIAKSESLERPPFLNYDSYLRKSKLSDMDVLELQLLDQQERKNDIVIKFRDFDGINDHEYETLRHTKENVSIRVRKLEESYGPGYLSLQYMRKLDIGLPGGISGRQAIFSILENIIRNAAKHGNFSNNKNLTITLDVFEAPNSKDKDYPYNLFNCDKSKKYVDSDDLYIMTITDNLIIDEAKFKELKIALEDSYVNNAGEMNNRSKGLKEMRISAAWIRRIVDEDVVKLENRAPIIQAFRTNEGYLQYVIYLPKALNAAVILESKKELLKYKSNNEISYLDIDSFKKKFNHCYDIIAVKKGHKKVIKEIHLSAPQRIIEIVDNDLNELSLTNLYANLVKNEVDIFILDGVYKPIRGKKAKQKIKYKTDFGVNEFINGSYFYKKHLETEKEFSTLIRDLVKEKYNEQDGIKPRPAFAEGISGSNSTDRLVRNDIINDRWYYKHLHSMQQQIGIFDERLFYYTTKLDDHDLDSANSIEGDYLSVINAFKNVYVFNIIYNNETSLFDIYGYKDYILCTDGIVKSLIKCIGHIFPPDNLNVINIEFEEGRFEKYFHNISIHQGILDKIYEQWNIGDNGKKAVTETFRMNFMTTNKLYECSGMSIHSGRSKPSSKDMPQQMPFIQYASIENAFLDCKYILVELLELAQYE